MPLRRTAWRAVFAVLLVAPGGAFGQGFAPEVAAGKMSVAYDVAVELVAAEPLVRQPVAIEFDDRGRLWVVQYLQYPNPAGLRRAKVDRYSRTEYDRVPPPPPRGPKGADRITILADTDTDGRMDSATDFLAGLNLASSIAFGNGGVYVLQPPYLLFYADRDRDDRPDGDPEVLLEGFGLQDAHSVANSMTWGPDGWLYGCQGSTVTSRVRGIEFQQGVWRYQPAAKRFELFCEGGGNSWGLDFDADGQLFYSTNHGGYIGLHGEQGGYYWKSFAKHGELHNPYAFGFFDHMPHEGFRGGHVSVGGIVYQGTALPDRYRGRIVAADLLGHGVYFHELIPNGSSYRTRHAGEILLAQDTWFAPSDVSTGPDGCIYVSDWHDARTAHPDPDADWDRTNGRIYRIRPRPPRERPPSLDLGSLSSRELLRRIDDPEEWIARRARRILGERREATVLDELKRRLSASSNDRLALRELWTLAGADAVDEELALFLLESPSPAVRRWSVRILGDRSSVSARGAARLVRAAEQDPSPVVRAQLVQSARRLEARHGLPIAAAVVRRDADGDDPHIPLLCWWAVEPHALKERATILATFANPDAWSSRLHRDVVIGRLVRRYAIEGGAAGLAACAEIFASAPGKDAKDLVLAALDQGLEGKRFDAVPVELAEVAAGLSEAQGPLSLRLGVRWGHPPSIARAKEVATSTKAPASSRVAAIEALAHSTSANAGFFMDLIETAGPDEVRLAAIRALGPRMDAGAAKALAGAYATLPASLRSAARSVLFARADAAESLLAVLAKEARLAAELDAAELASLATFASPRLDQLIRSIWGRVSPPTPEEKLAEIRRIHNDLRAADGSASAGKSVYAKLCASCHVLFGEGNRIGPELTSANRGDRDYLLRSIVDPSAVIRKEFVAAAVATTDGRLFHGLVVDEGPSSLTLLTAKNERIPLSREEISQRTESAHSLMPERLLSGLRPQELRDLFAYLQHDPPAAGTAKLGQGSSP